jgi:hypothetical protein
MHIRALEKIGIKNLHFYAGSIHPELLSELSVNGHAVNKDEVESHIQEYIDKCVSIGKRIAIFPEGPYCSPVQYHKM